MQRVWAACHTWPRSSSLLSGEPQPGPPLLTENKFRSCETPAVAIMCLSTSPCMDPEPRAVHGPPGQGRRRLLKVAALGDAGTPVPPLSPSPSTPTSHSQHHWLRNSYRPSCRAALAATCLWDHAFTLGACPCRPTGNPWWLRPHLLLFVHHYIPAILSKYVYLSIYGLSNFYDIGSYKIVLKNNFHKIKITYPLTIRPNLRTICMNYLNTNNNVTWLLLVQSCSLIRLLASDLQPCATGPVLKNVFSSM